MTEVPRLERFERSVDSRNFPQALADAIAILGAIDQGYGRIEGVRWIAGAQDSSPAARHREFATRFIAALGQLFVSPGFNLDFTQFEVLQQYSRWIELMSSLSGFGSMDGFIRRLGADGENLDISASDILRFLGLYMPHSSLNVPFETLHRGHDVGFVITALGWIGSRYCFNRPFFDLREKLLEWITPRLKVTRLGEISLSRVTEPFFHCSYAMGPHKHDVKAELMVQLRRALLEAGAREMPPGGYPVSRGSAKPVIVVTAEYINPGHSIHRTHSKSLRSLRRKFHVVLVCNGKHSREISRDLYDEVIPFPDDKTFFAGLVDLSASIVSREPVAVLHMAVGMVGHVIGLSSLKLAPVQFASYGHTSTTMSPVIDFMVLPEDFVSDESRFSEQLMKLPREAMPYEPRTDVDFAALRDGVDRTNRPFVEVAVPGTLMKLNPVFFETIGKIRAAAKSPCRFRFFPGFCVGLTHAELDRQIRRYVPDALVNAELPYADYCSALAACDFSLSPFPYGNMNTVVESVALGLPGVCLDGPEPHSHLDGALYARLGLPACLNAQTIDAYVAEAVRLIDDPSWRQECRAAAKAAPLEDAIYTGDESLFCDAVWAAVEKTKAAA